MMLLSNAAKAMHAELHGQDGKFISVGTDSRSIEQGQLFFALKGEHFDGHAYAEAALAQGAAAVVVNRESDVSQTLMPALAVDDTYQALGKLANAWRNTFDGTVFGVTGSNGKTTVKEMLASILIAEQANADAVLATKGNLNNHIGAPLTLLSIRPSHKYAVVEMGMNHAGEIRYLTKIAEPNIVVINNAGTAHIGELGSMQAIAEAKGEILEGLPQDGIAVLNGDDTFYSYWAGLTDSKSCIVFGMRSDCDVAGEWLDSGLLRIVVKSEAVDVKLPSLGEHNARNALAATAAAMAAGVSLAVVKQGLEAFKGVQGRLQRLTGLNGALVINDTYNANPMSMRAAIDVLSQLEGVSILAVGDMGELGVQAEAMHAELGAYAKAKGISRVFAFGELSKEFVKAFGSQAEHFSDIEQMNNNIKEQLDTGVNVLVKGSRFMKMERVVNAIIESHKGGSACY